jgi:predicted transcriptional regulator of viral defense system
MNVGFLKFKEVLFAQGIFSTSHIQLFFPDFNTDNLLNWQKKGYIIKLRNKWYCFKEFAVNPDSSFIIANQVYAPSYISHQQALMFYGLIPEHIVASTSVTTRKTASFDIISRTYKYYSVKQELFFGYKLMELNINGINRSIMIAEKEKAILDLLYLYSFYKSMDDLKNLRLNEQIMQNEISWHKMDAYAMRFKSKTLLKKLGLLKKIFTND